MGSGRTRLPCAMCTFLEAHNLERSKPTQRRFWQKRQLVIKQRIEKAYALTSLNPCNDDHKAGLAAMRLVKHATELHDYTKKIDKLGVAIQILGNRQRVYDEKLLELGPSHAETKRAKLELSHQKSVVSQRKRRAAEVNPKPVINQEFTTKDVTVFGPIIGRLSSKKFDNL